MKTLCGTCAAEKIAAAICPGVRLVDGRLDDGKDDVCVTEAFGSFVEVTLAVEDAVD